MRRGAPSFAGCVLTPLLAAGVLQVLLKAACSASYDTAHLVLAVIAGAAVYRMDRAICGPARRASASAVLPVGDGASIAGENARR